MSARPAIIFGAAPLGSSSRIARRLSSLHSPAVFAADGGLRTATSLGFTADAFVGDFDSLGRLELEQLSGPRTSVQGYPRDKDWTDGELAAARAIRGGFHPLLLVGFLGGPRLDHMLANVALLTNLPADSVLVEEFNECGLLTGPGLARWEPDGEDIISLIPFSDHAQGVTTEGLHWRLAGETLRLGETRGVSNEPEARTVSVYVREGRLLIVKHYPVEGAHS